jgi:hypothetical protein
MVRVLTRRATWVILRQDIKQQGDNKVTEKKRTTDRVSYSLEPDYQRLLAKIAKKMRSNMTAELRKMIDERAASIGLKPIVPVAPKRNTGDD